MWAARIRSTLQRIGFEVLPAWNRSKVAHPCCAAPTHRMPRVWLIKINEIEFAAGRYSRRSVLPEGVYEEIISAFSRDAARALHGYRPDAATCGQMVGHDGGGQRAFIARGGQPHRHRRDMANVAAGGSRTWCSKQSLLRQRTACRCRELRGSACPQCQRQPSDSRLHGRKDFLDLDWRRVQRPDDARTCREFDAQVGAGQGARFGLKADPTGKSMGCQWSRYSALPLGAGQPFHNFLGDQLLHSHEEMVAARTARRSWTRFIIAVHCNHGKAC